jgi:hypothetical protein
LQLTKIDYGNRAACLVCAIKSRCTKDYRKVSRLDNEAVLDRMAARRKARPEIPGRRKSLNEIKELFSRVGLHLGMDVGNWTLPTRSIVSRKSRE